MTEQELRQMDVSALLDYIIGDCEKGGELIHYIQYPLREYTKNVLSKADRQTLQK